MQTSERMLEKEYEAFKTSFHSKCSDFACEYFYPNSHKHTDSLYSNIIQQYYTKHRKSSPSAKNNIKALSQETKRLLNSLPEDLRETVHNLTPARANLMHKGNQSHKQLWQLSRSNKYNIKKYYTTIVQYYVISTHIVELKRYAQQVQKKLKSTVAFPSTYSHCKILLWHEHLLPFVGKIRFQNEWYAIYYSMKHCLGPRPMHAFANMMNQWFPHCPVPCTYDSISDYNFLTTTPPDLWLSIPITNKTKATSRGILRIHTFLTTYLSEKFDPADAHFLF